MNTINYQILDSSVSDNGSWFNISPLQAGFSLHIVGLEADGKINVLLHNSYNIPTSTQFPVADQAALFTTISGSNGDPILSMQNVQAAWVQLVKIPGQVPTETTVRIFGSY